jgi:hypothetical protein
MHGLQWHYCCHAANSQLSRSLQTGLLTGFWNKGKDLTAFVLLTATSFGMEVRNDSGGGYDDLLTGWLFTNCSNI